MSTVEVFRGSNLSSNKVADVISVLDHSDPSLYGVEWESEGKNHATTYNVEEFRFGNGPKMKLRGKRGDDPATYIIDSNPLGRPQVIHVQKDGYRHKERLVGLRILSEKFHWRLQVQHISDDLQKKLELANPF